MWSFVKAKKYDSKFNFTGMAQLIPPLSYKPSISCLSSLSPQRERETKDLLIYSPTRQMISWNQRDIVVNTICFNHKRHDVDFTNCLYIYCLIGLRPKFAPLRDIYPNFEETCMFGVRIPLNPPSNNPNFIISLKPKVPLALPANNNLNLCHRFCSPTLLTPPSNSSNLCQVFCSPAPLLLPVTVQTCIIGFVLRPPSLLPVTTVQTSQQKSCNQK